MVSSRPEFTRSISSGPVREKLSVGRRELFSDQALNRGHQLLVSHFLEMLLQAAKSHVRQILPPFEIRNRHAAGIQKDVRNDHDAARVQSVFGAGRCGAIGGFGENLRPDAMAIVQRDLIFESGGNQNVAVRIPDGIRRERLTAGKITDGSGCLPMVVEFFDIQARWIDDAGIPFADRDDSAAVFLRKKVAPRDSRRCRSPGSRPSFHRVPLRVPASRTVFGEPKGLANPVLNAAASGFPASGDSALRDRLSGDAGKIVDAARDGRRRRYRPSTPSRVRRFRRRVRERFRRGPMNSFLINSAVNRRVIFSICSGVYFLGLNLTPPLEPPKGTSTIAHLYVISAASAMISSALTISL